MEIHVAPLGSPLIHGVEYKESTCDQCQFLDDDKCTHLLGYGGYAVVCPWGTPAKKSFLADPVWISNAVTEPCLSETLLSESGWHIDSKTGEVFHPHTRAVIPTVGFFFADM